MKLHPFRLAIALALLCVLPTAGQTFDDLLVNPANQITQEISGGTIFYTSRAEVSAATQPNLVVDYGALGDTPVSVTWRAPAGQWIEINVPVSGWELDIVAVSLAYGTIGFSAGGISPTFTVTSEDFTSTNGVAPTVVPTSFITGPGGDAFGAQAFINGILPGEVYTFSELTIQATIPASFGVAFDAPPFEYRILGELNASSPEANPAPPADPGQWIRVVPEPSSLALLGLGGLAMLRSRRR